MTPPGGALWTVVGTAAGVWDDLEVWRPSGPVMLVNRAIKDYDGAASAGAALHEWSVSAWAPKVPVWSPRAAPGITNIAPATLEWHGTSALYAVEVLLRRYHARRIVLTGCPLDGTGHYYKPGDLGLYLDHYRAGWLAALPYLAGRVRSMGGWTRDVLGTPDAAWLS